MERSALYRRALAPIFTFAGIAGIIAAIAGWKLKLENIGTFAAYWMAVCIVVIAGALILVRRQALKQAEKFWSLPTRRVTQAVIPALLAGLAFGLAAAVLNDFKVIKIVPEDRLALIVVWMVLYGLALHAAGFFVQRGIRLFGWGFIIAGITLLYMGSCPESQKDLSSISPHWLMGILFGVSHLACGIYLYFSEQRKNEA